MQNLQTIYFPADGSRVVTGMCPKGEFGAYLVEGNENLRGYGHTRLAAIADLNVKLAAAEGLDIQTSLQPNNEWTALDANTYDCDCDQDGFFSTSTIGWGKTEADAISDLLDQMEEA